MSLRYRRAVLAIATLTFVSAGIARTYHLYAQGPRTLGAAFETRVLAAALPEAPFDLRFFTGAVKTKPDGSIITGPGFTGRRNLVGAEPAGERAGLERFTKIMFGVSYFDGRPSPGDRIDPNNPRVSSGSQHWPHVKQPMRSWPNAVAVTPDGANVYVTLPGREGYPDWRVAVVNTASRTVSRWIDLRPAGQTRGTRPVGVAVSPVNPQIFPRAYAVVANEYANFATVIDTGNDTVLGYFATDFYAEDLVFNAAGTRLYTTDRFKDQVRAFAITAGPTFTQIAEIPTGTNDLDRANPRDLAISADGRKLFVATTLGHTIAVIDIDGDANTLTANMPVGGLATDVKVAGRWGIVSGHETNNTLDQPETGHGLPKIVNGVAIRNNGQPLGYTPVMSDATQATTFDDIGTELNVFDTATNHFVFRYVDFERNKSMLAVPGQTVDLGDFAANQTIIRGSGAEQMAVRGNLLFVSQLHSDKVEVFRVDQNPSDASGILTQLAIEFTGGITPQGLVPFAGRQHHLRRQHADRGSVVHARQCRRHADAAGARRCRRHRQHARSGEGWARRSSLRDTRGGRPALAVHAVVLRRRAEVVRPLPLAEPSRWRQLERRRERGRRREGLSAEQGHFRQLAGVVRGTQQRHELVRVVL